MADTDSGLLDTSVVVDLDVLDPDLLPARASVSAVTMAELSAGPHAADDFRGLEQILTIVSV